MHFWALYVPPRSDYRNTNRSGLDQDSDAQSVCLPGSSSLLSDVADSRGKGQDSLRMLPLPVGDSGESAMARTLRSVKSLSH